MINGGHTSRTLLVSQKFPGMLVVSRGSEGNLDALCRDETSGHCQIRAFNMSESNPGSPFNFTTDGVRLGWGLRNSVGVAENPVVGGIWSVENSVDNLERAGEDIHRDNPGEELNYHGSFNDTDGGGNYGYPECLALWETDGFPERGDLATGNQFIASGNTDAPEDSRCKNERVAPRLTFQAHTAPLDILFTPDGSEALVTFHGSCTCRTFFCLFMFILTRRNCREQGQSGWIQAIEHFFP
jgi:glucose/arabinose dehydrogenase